MTVSEQQVSAHSFIIERAEITSPEFKNRRFDIRNVILEIDIFENINKPYLTGTIMVIDDNSLYAGLNFRGVESLLLTLRLPDAGFLPITKRFYMDRVLTNQRANDQEAVLLFHLIEDIGFTNEYINVNESFEGKGADIIEQIVKRYFNKTIKRDPLVTEIQPPLKVVVPNITPLEAAEWIKDRITAPNGSPYYLFSTLALPELQLRNFQTMIFNPPNTTTPFRYSQALVNKQNLTLDEEMFIIENHHDNETADITRLNDSGFINARYVFHDVVRNRMFVPGNTQQTRYYDGQGGGNVFGKRWTAHGLFKTRFFEGRPETSPFQRLANPYPNDARLPWKLDTDPTSQNGQENPFIYERPESRLITQVFASRQYGEQFYGYNEGRSDADHLHKVDAKAIRNWAVTDPLTLTVPGRLFLTGGLSATIGYKYRLEFTTYIGEAMFRDPRRSGEYLIYSARHSFARDHGYRVHLTGVGVDQRGLETRDQIDAPATPIVGPQ